MGLKSRPKSRAESVRWAVFISGRGSNLARLLDQRDEIDIRLVLSSSADAPGFFRARRAGVPALVTPTKTATSKVAHPMDWLELDRILRERLITHICLAGFMKIVPAHFIEKWRGRIVNLHPSLLPAYPGLDSIAKSHADAQSMGLTVHEVVAQVDQGPIIFQRLTLQAGEAAKLSLGNASFQIHRDEQRVLSAVLRTWRESA
jgi:phosphoribosylglycinamide formyltransferase-1